MSSFTNSSPDREKSPYALEVLGVSKSFGSVDVLKKVDLKLKVGECVALMGPSGSGKSTLLNCICGIEPVDSGEIKVGGKSLSQLDGANLELLRRESIGYVFQSFHLLPTLSAFENIEFPGQLVGMPKKERLDRVAQLLESVGLSHRSEHLPDALSGGECQRVAIARALMHFPRLLLADEPTGSLDTSSGDQILELLEELSQEHSVALLLVTHDHTSTRICDRVISMRDGSLSQ
jgi:putative ABC transport system ATP-binding protein